MTTRSAFSQQFRRWHAQLTRSLVAASVFAATATPVLAALATDVIVSTDRSTARTSIISPAFSTTAPNELLLAFISTDATTAGVTVSGVSGAGLTWSLVRRTNVQLGTAEVWRAFAPTALSRVTVTATISQSVAASMTVVTYTGADPGGAGGSGAIGATAGGNANPGAPTATLITTRDNSWVFGVGNDFDHAIARTLGPGQTMVHQYLATVGDTYWVQRQTAPTAVTGTTVTINDTAPAADRYNLTAVEVLPATAPGLFSISGSISPSTSGAGATVQLTGNASATATADVNGTFTFSGLANGAYTVTPVKSGFVFSPASQQVTISGASQVLPAFTAAAQTWMLSGTISPAAAGAGAVVTIGGAATGTAIADGSGIYTFQNLPTGTYSVTPGKPGFTFSPASQTISLTTANATNVNFTASTTTYSISGTIAPASGGAGALVTMSGTPSATVIANASGAFVFTGASPGSYTITARRTGYSFTPDSQTVVVGSANVSNVGITATALPAPPVDAPDLSDVINGGQISIAGAAATRELQYTHDTFNGGTGPLLIQPVYNQASGTYQGIQYIYKWTGSQWTLQQQVPLAGAFVFHAQHGHFHFPFASYGLYATAADGGIGALVSSSSKIGFCIADSFIYDSLLPNAGALGNLGACTDPTALRGLDIGAVDEYDRTDEGQSIPLANVPDGTYWLRAIVDPNNFFTESDKANNETDVQLAISGSAVQILQTITPILAPPPAITMTAPASGATVAGAVSLAADTATVAGVQYLLDGQPLGGVVATAPYTLAWDTTGAVDGKHWLAAQTTDSSGRTGTSAVVQVTVSNGTPIDTTPPTVQITDPAAGTTVSASVAVGATAADNSGVTSVQFYVDGAAIGSAVTTAPYIIYWDTLSYADGQHTLTAVATDLVGLSTTSAAVTVTVDNSHPPNAIGKDVTVSVDGSGTLQTPLFSTTTAGHFLVAFVAYDGPLGTPQTMTVSGAGLSWTLLKRSNVQAGTAEIWAAQAPAALTGARVQAQPSVGTTYHGSLTVIAFTNAAGAGVVGQASAPSGAPDIFLPGVAAGNWVFAVGNDWDNAIARTAVSGQVLVHEKVDTVVGDTYWVQSTAAPATATALVDIQDSAPTADRWNYAAVEIVATRK